MASNRLSKVTLPSGDSYNLSVPYIVGTGSTAGTWLGSLDNLTEYYDGLLILYKPAVAGASTTTLNINSLGAKTCYVNNTTKLTTHFPVNQPILLVYSTSQNSGCWMCIDDYWTNSDTYTSAYCGTAAATAAKGASMTYYTATPNSFVHINFRYANTAASALTLNINSQGAKPIYINGAASSATNYTLPAGPYIAYYDGTNYYFRTDGKLTASITGDAATVNGLTVQTAVPANAVFTDTKVTSSTNHYTPATASGQDKTASASGATAAWGIDVVKGVTLNTDGKGHVTGLSVTSGKIPGNPDTDTKVTQTADDSTNSNFECLFSATADNTTRTETSKKSSKLKFNPSTGNLQATQLNGVAIGSSPKFTDTTYTFAGGTNKITVTPSGGTAQDVAITVSDSTKLPLAGGTLTGRVKFNNVAMPLSAGKVTGLSAGTTEVFKDGIAISNPATSNDVGWIRVTGTGETDTVMEIATGDDAGGTNPEEIVARKYNTSNVVVHEAKLLDKTGNAIFPKDLSVGGASGATLQYNTTTQSLDFVFA